MNNETIRIAELMATSGVKFGTSGARGLAVDMTDRVCYAYTLAFLHYLQEVGQVQPGMSVALAGDYRPSTPRIMAAVTQAVADAGCEVINCGFVPTPTLACFSIGSRPGIMVTGSHIPDDRNGIKFYKPAGEILKQDEDGISTRSVTIPAGCFDESGAAIAPVPLPKVWDFAHNDYIRRYIDFLPEACLEGKRIAIYQHSSVARDLLFELFACLGAQVTSLGRSDTFIPVDTEAVRPEDVELARQWAAEGEYDAIVSADGDGDRPLISDEFGQWLRGDVAGILCARYLKADKVVTPVSSNSAVEKCGWFAQVSRTRIGSPYVIAAMEEAAAEGGNVVGYEANGGFLTASAIKSNWGVLPALPTRDAAIVPIALLLLASEHKTTISGLQKLLPARFTSSDRLKNFPTEISLAKLAEMGSGGFAAIEALFGDLFGRVKAVDHTDGLRITFASDEVVHLRPSGNAPELRCYNEAASEARASEMNALCLKLMEGWR